MKNSVSVSALILAFSAMAGVAVLSTACGDDDATSSSSSSGSTGTSGNASSGDGGSSGTSGTSGTGTSSSGDSGPGKTDAELYAAATCAHEKKCFPDGYAAKYANDAACENPAGSGTSGTPVTYPGNGTLDLKACAAAVGTQACETALGTLPDACKASAGTLDDGKGCNVGQSQCKSGSSCAMPDAKLCGKCTVAPAPVAKGGTCDVTGTKPCDKGLFCDTAGGNTCKDRIASGAACTAATGASCIEGTYCTAVAGGADGTCDPIVGIGKACKPTTSSPSQSTCYFGLYCDTTCKEPTYGAAGDICDGTKKLCKTGTACDTNNSGDKKCIATLAEGVDCNAAPATDKPCGAGLACTGTPTKCTKPTAVTPNVCAQ